MYFLGSPQIFLESKHFWRTSQDFMFVPTWIHHTSCSECWFSSWSCSHWYCGSTWEHLRVFQWQKVHKVVCFEDAWRLWRWTSIKVQIHLRDFKELSSPQSPHSAHFQEIERMTGSVPADGGLALGQGGQRSEENGVTLCKLGPPSYLCWFITPLNIDTAATIPS
jgi:hypothetical protein